MRVYLNTGYEDFGLLDVQVQNMEYLQKPSQTDKSAQLFKVGPDPSSVKTLITSGV